MKHITLIKKKNQFYFQKQDPSDVILSEIGESFTFFAPSDDAMQQFMSQRVPEAYFDDPENVMSFFQWVERQSTTTRVTSDGGDLCYSL